jgi:hypothetical protein
MTFRAKADLRHVRIEHGTTVTLLRERNRCGWIDGEFVVLETVPAGTEGEVYGSVNAGFNGLLYHVRLPDGRRLVNLPASDLVAFA